MRMKVSMVAGLAATIIAAGLGGEAQSAEVKLKAASFLPERVIFAKFFFRWAREVNTRCSGKVNISIVGPAAIKSLEQWSALKTGVVDMHYGPANYYRGVVPAGDVFTLAENDPAEQRRNGAWKLMNDLHEKKLNAHYLTTLANGVQFYIYTTKPATGGRFDGFRLRSVPIYDEFFKSLGAQPVRMPPPAVRTALERKIIDGYGWPLWGIKGFGWIKFTKYRYGPGFFAAAVPILVNLDKWKSLEAGQRQCLTDMAKWIEGEWPKWRAAESKQQLQNQTDAGIKYVDLGPKFAPSAHASYWAALRKSNPAYVDAVKPLLTK